MHADQVGQGHRPAGFLPRLTHGGVLQALEIIQMPGGLVVSEAAGDFLFDHQIAVTIGHDACHGHVWAPDVVLGVVMFGHQEINKAWGRYWKWRYCAITSSLAAEEHYRPRRILEPNRHLPRKHGERTGTRTRRWTWSYR